MQGTVISKRWIAMFTAVGLISLLVALFSPAWSGSRGQVNAQTSVCVATSGGTTPTLPTAVDHVVVLPNEVTLTAGQTQLFQAYLCASDGTEITSGYTVAWLVSPSTAGSIATDGIFTAGSVSVTTNVTIMADAMATGTTGVVAVGTSTAIVTPPPPPPPTPTAIPPFTGPTPVPPPKPADVQVQEQVLPDEAVTAAATDASGAKVIEVSIPAGTLDEPAFIQVGVLTPAAADAAAALEDLPPTLLKVGDKIVEINLVDSTGAKITGPLNQPVTIRIPYTDAEAAAVGGALNLRILRYDTVSKGWAPLNTTVDTVKKELSAQLSSFSIFALGRTVAGPTPTVVAPTATAVPPAVLPSTGGVAPSTSVLAGLLLGGIAMVAAGAIYMRRRQHGKI